MPLIHSRHCTRAHCLFYSINPAGRAVLKVADRLHSRPPGQKDHDGPDGQKDDRAREADLRSTLEAVELQIEVPDALFFLR